MSNKPRKYCQSFPCRNLAEPGSAYCREHKRATAQKETDSFYLSTTWRRFRNWYLKNHPLCEQCEREGRLMMADMVDHIIEIKDGGAKLSEENVQALCWKCHGIKTAEEKGRRKNHQQSSGDNRAGSQIVS